MSKFQQSRRAMLAKIHMAKKDLVMSDDEYRAILSERFGVESSAKLNMTKLHGLCRHFETLGWQPVRKAKPRTDIDRMCRKIWAQCYSLERPVPEYADGVAKQMFGVEKLIWCDHSQLRAITTALAKQQDREEAPTS